MSWMSMAASNACAGLSVYERRPNSFALREGIHLPAEPAEKMSPAEDEGIRDRGDDIASGYN